MSMLSGDHLRQIEREAIRVVELERIVTRNHGLVAELVHPRQSPLDRLEEALLLGTRDALDVRLLRPELRIDIAHHARDRTGEWRERRLPPAQEPGVSHRAPQNAPQDITAPLVGRVDTIRHPKRTGACMGGEYARGRAEG